jgi:hypothetical protein
MNVRKSVVSLLAACGLIAAVGSANATIISVIAGSAVNGNRATNLLTNGSFETGNSGSNLRWSGNAGQATGGTPNGNGPSTPIPGWGASYGAGAYGWWGPLGFAGAPCTDGVACLYFGNFFTTASQTPTFTSNGVVTFPSAPSFTNSNANNQIPTVLSQQLVGLTLGGTYTLDFWVSGEANNAGFNGAGIFGLNIGSTDQVFLTDPGTAANPGGITGTSSRYFVTFTADNASELLSFTNWGHRCSSCTELVLDDVIVNRAAPEPATLALLALGLGGLGLTRRRKLN